MRRIVIFVFVLAAGFAAGCMFVNSWSHGQPGQPPPLPRDASYRDVVKRVLPAVVSIETRAKNKTGGMFNDPRIPEEFRRPAPRDPDKLGFGSGFFVDTGVVVTNYHVVEGADRCRTAGYRKFTSDHSQRSPHRRRLDQLDVKDEKFATLEFGDPMRWKSAIACWRSWLCLASRGP